MSESTAFAEAEKVAPVTPDPASLVQAISGGATNPLSLLLSQLGGQAPDDPRVALMTQLLEQRLAAAPAGPAEDEEETQAARLAAEEEGRERARRLRELDDTVKQVYAELKVLRERNDALAAALGACFLCFGTDPYCAECGGRGVPGSRLPEPAAWSTS